MNIYTSNLYPVYAQLVTSTASFVDKINLFKFPTVVRVETTNMCNGNCITCPRHKLTRPQGVMDFDLFRKIVDECSNKKVQSLHLHNFGEPLLDNQLPMKINYAKSKGISNVRIFSNLSLLNEEMAEKIIRSGLDDLKVSFDGSTKEEFEEIRKDISFDDVRKNIYMVVKLRKKLGFKKPRISLVFVRVKNNNNKKSNILSEWKGIVDNIFVSYMHNWGGAFNHNGKNGKLSRKKLLPCLRIWKTFTILWDGRVALCCLDYDGKVILGNVRETSIEEIFNGEVLKSIRNLHLQRRFEEIEICAECSARK